MARPDFDTVRILILVCLWHSERVKPMFQYLSDQTGLISMLWYATICACLAILAHTHKISREKYPFKGNQGKYTTLDRKPPVKKHFILSGVSKSGGRFSETRAWIRYDQLDSTPCESPRKLEAKAIVDAICFSITVSYCDQERLTVESSSGGSEEHVIHTQDDSLKLLEAMTLQLKQRTYQYKYTSLKTLLECRALGVIVVKRRDTALDDNLKICI